MRRFVFGLLALVALCSQAHAQHGARGYYPAYAGSTTAISSTGYSVNSGSLFLTPASKLGFGTPYSIAYWIKSNSYGQSTSFVLDARGGSSIGFADGAYYTGNNGFVWAFFGVAANNDACAFRGQSCARLQTVDDNNWHLVARTFDGTTAITYVDGVRQDSNTNTANGTAYVPATGFWQLWSGTPPSNSNVRDMWVWNVVQPHNFFEVQYRLGAAGNSPTGAPYTSNLVGHWTFGNCTNVGTPSASCPDSASSPSNWIADGSPTVAVTAPSNGASGLSGNVTTTATCTDSIGVASLTIFIDGVSQNTTTSSPNTFTWDSTKFIDGSHSFYAICNNAGGNVQTSATITASTSNSVIAKTVFLDPTSPTDCPTNNGLTTGQPCATFAGVMSILSSNPLHGGDSILIQHGTTLNLSSMTAATVLVLCGPSGYALGANCTQNVYPGQTITLGTYGGSGNCTVLAGVTSDCAIINLAANGTVTAFAAMINAVNVPNLIIENLRLFGNQPNALITPGCNYSVSGCAYGIIYGSAGGYFNGSPTNTASIQNNEIDGFTTGMVIYNTMAPTFPTSGTLCHAAMQDNYVYQPSISTSTSYAINVIGANCGGGLARVATGGSAISNYVNNYGGLLNNALSGVGFETTTAFNSVENFNVASNIAYNMNTCGAGYGMEWYQTQVGVAKGNEVFNVFPGPGNGGCDHGGLDPDLGVNNITYTFNYVHETWGPSMNLLLGSVGSYVQGSLTTAYSILEDGTAQTSNLNGGLVGIGAQTGYYNFYNNDVWNGYNGLTVSPNAFITKVAGIAYAGCAPLGNIVANNIVVANGNGSASPEVVYGSDPTAYPTCPSLWSFKSNDYHPLSGTLLWRSIISNLDAITTIGAWNSAVSATDIAVNPNFSGTGGGAVVCYTALSGVPVQPGALHCPNNYVLNTGSAMIGVGTNLTTALAGAGGLPPADYFTNTIPNGVGTGYNIGADGGNP